MENSIQESLIKEIKSDPENFSIKVLRLYSAAKSISALYPTHRDDPSDEDLLTWMELNSAADNIVKKHIN